MRQFHPPQRRPSRREAFTLLELLAVLTIVGILLALAAPSLVSISGGNSTRAASETVAGVLRNAQGRATSTASWVWVRCLSDAEGISLTTYASRDGGKALTEAEEAVLVGNTVRIPRFVLASNLGVFADSPRPVADLVGPATGGWIAFSPAGEARFVADLGGELPPVPEANLVRWIELGLRRAVGGESDPAAVLVAGLTGQVEIFRP